MLRVGQKRRRTTGEVKQAQEDSISKQKEIEAKLRKYEELKVINEHLRAEAANHRNSTDILNDLHSKKKIHVNQEGEVLVPGFDQLEEQEDLADPNQS